MSHASRVLGRIRQLCCLGLGGEAVMPALLREVRQLVPSYSSAFFWADENSQIKNLYAENPVMLELAPLYLTNSKSRHSGRRAAAGRNPLTGAAWLRKRCWIPGSTLRAAPE